MVYKKIISSPINNDSSLVYGKNHGQNMYNNNNKKKSKDYTAHVNCI